jgi:four helix bundle protein
MQDYRRLLVWNKSHVLTLEVYRATRSFPVDERYGLTTQMRRCAASIPANIAEGCGRDSPKELRRFLAIASGSAHELEYHLILAHDLGYVSDIALAKQVAEIKRMLTAFMRSLESKETKPTHK